MKRPIPIFLVLLCIGINPISAQETQLPYSIPIVVVKYFPVKDTLIDKNLTGDWGASLNYTILKIDTIISGVIKALEEGSRFRGYKNKDAKPSLKYSILDTYEFLEPMPTYEKPFHKVPMTDYRKIVERIDIKKWIEEKGVKEVWIFGYHGGVIDLWESNMSSPFGDVSNSDRDEKDLPIFSKTYTVYHYNYQRHISEAVEDHIHQDEAVFYNVDKELFWNKFVGWFPGGKWGKAETKMTKNRRCGWAHYPPNAEKDYDWKNKNYVETDIEDWKPDGSGSKININCERWNCNSLEWFILWMQSIPGANNELKDDNKALNNWWMFIGDYDNAMKKGLKLSN